MLVRNDGRIRWLGTFGVQRPLGRTFPWLHALTANRGPVCDDQQLWASAAEELAEIIREESYAYLDVLPEWIGQADGDHPNFVDHSKWHSAGKPRASLRLDLNPGEEEIFAIFVRLHGMKSAVSDWEPPSEQPLSSTIADLSS